jgi:hypothetical protein
MHPFFEHKRWVILFSLLGLGALIVLSSGLRDIPFREAQSFGRNQIGDFRYVPANIVNSIVEVPFAMQLSVWVIFILMFVLLGLLMTPEWRRRLIKIAIRVAVIYWGLYLLFVRYRDMLVEMGVNAAAVNAGNASASSTGNAPPEFLSPRTISLASYILSFGVALLLLFVAWKAYTFWKEMSAASSGQPLKQIAKIARSSIHDLSSGRNSTDVIVNCYLRMSDVIAAKRKMHRGDSVTPAEFAIQLQNAGLPSDPVQRLTHLFEAVRYGDRRTNPKDVNEAVSCLTTILHHCGESI